MASSFHIAAGRVARGKLTGAGEVVVDGRLEGAIDVTGRVDVARGGSVEGPVRATEVEVRGTVHGGVAASEGVAVRSGGVVRGDVHAPRVRVDDDARVDGTLAFDPVPEAGRPAPDGLRFDGTMDAAADSPGGMPPLRRLRGRWRGGPLVAGLLAGLMLLGACAEHALTVRPAPRSFTPDDYDDIYDAWTREQKAFSLGELSDVLHVTATFESWEFRWAYVVRYADDYSLDAAERDTMLRATLADAQEHHRFFVTLSSNRFRESDLTGAEAAWRVLLVDGKGRATKPAEIEKIKKPTVAERVYFPSISPFRQAFRITFPAKRADGTLTIPAGAPRAVLRFTGALGQVDLEWDLAGGD